MIYHMPIGAASSAPCEQRVSLISAFTGYFAGREESGLPPDINLVYYQSQLNRITGQSSQLCAKGRGKTDSSCRKM